MKYRVAFASFAMLASFALMPANAQQPAGPGGALQPVRPQAAPVPAPAQQLEAAPIPKATPEHFAAARELVVMSGLARSFEAAIPDMMRQISTSVTRTRPELAAPLKETLEQLQPQFMQLILEMMDNSARIYTALLNEKETRDALVFFKSDSGKKFIETQPNLFANIAQLMQEWTKFLSTRMYDMTREEMKKKGISL